MNSTKTNLRDERVQQLMEACQQEVLRQIIGPFGLTPAMFDDKDGGNVATVHNADQSVFPDELHEKNYEIANDSYSQQIRQKHWDDKSARGKTHKANNEALDAGQDVLSDATQKPMTKGEIHGDHTVSLKEVHGDNDLPPLSRTKSMELSPLILENGGYEDHTIYRRADHRIPQAS